MYSLQGAGYDLLRNPDKFYETLGMKTPTQASNQSSSLAPTKENQAKRASQTQSKTSSRQRKRSPVLKAALKRMNRHIQNRRGAPLSMIGQRNTTNVCSA